MGITAAIVTAGAVLFAGQVGTDVVVVSGKLAHYRLTNDLFHIGSLWMRVEPNTLFHRWLSDAGGRQVSVLITSDPDRFGDAPNARILTGELHHGTAPQRGSTVLHTLVLRDSLTNTLGPIAFETDNPMTARKFDAFDGRVISIVIETH